mmetsp:Transcript_41130/g.30245  ORF Transcript_41130/g.30245 Transcript_41130/m.30245 type:complete len:119 (+) Transcript_41130:213-569(+)|eukprot:CAMPEP_0202957988 /NCGR_PEP_ID=MMETSP1396-20130829/2340_1 /ASSEMBLY_ACC=CAM_ASM_000872 /TAXON_ID= /ORGANISM="Pseudokeronopsis sp., Strain Brazil" /LENGTH=118 /DNA_ID=CAMNT_0049675761 /DNA_START=207 /DNA_END=563 /DNA_ORIENTATION=+
MNASASMHYNTPDMGHMQVVNFQDGTKRSYHLLQFHMHSPSEHTINGLHYDAEMHIVHLDERGKIAVIGIFFDRDDGGLTPNPFLDQLEVISGNKVLERISLKELYDSLRIEGNLYSY